MTTRTRFDHGEYEPFNPNKKRHLLEGFAIRDIDPGNESEVDLVVNRAMETVLETCPEFEGSSEKAQQAFSNFTFDQMKEMFTSVYDNPNHRTLLVIDEKGNIEGHAIFSIKVDEEGEKYGFCYSRYVAPRFRRNGAASKLLDIQEAWWKEKNAKYIFAQTHETNTKLQNLFEKKGFIKEGPINGKHYNYYILKKRLWPFENDKYFHIFNRL